VNRDQAVGVIKLIFEQCSQIEGKSIKLLPPNANGALADTFQIHIQTKDDDILQSCVARIAKEHGLAVKRKRGVFIVYKHYPNVNMSF